ncbi:MAG TPA: enoyl-CoA hydratase-related protein [Roseovarius sp.]|nr:enoyl-CoA hydratase-related protein [Roseovarius sp.]
MTSEVHIELSDGIAIVTLDRPVANALAPGLRAQLAQALTEAFGRDDVRAIVLRGAGSVFSSGIDIAEYDGELADPWIGDICTLIEMGPKPVVAALHGAALGGGLELALSAHARVAEATTRLAQPDLSLGLIPGGGATQRLPRLIGAQASLEFLLSAQPAQADDPRLARLCDRLVTGDPLAPALELARSLADRGAWTPTRERRRGFSDPEGYQRAVAAVTARIKGREGAEADLLKCIEAAQLLPFEQGLALEQTLFRDRLRAPDALCRRHLYTAERRAGIMPEPGRAGPVDPPMRVLMLGAGAELAEFSVPCLQAGRQVDVLSPSVEQANAVISRIARILDDRVKQRRLTGAAMEACLQRLAVAPGREALAAADLVVDSGACAVPENGDLCAHAIWAVLGTAREIAARRLQVPAPERLLGLRLYRPVQSTRLVEILVPDAVAPEAVTGLVRLLGEMGRIVVRASASGASAGDELQMALMRAALALAESGWSPYEVDAEARELGFAAGPFETADAEGLERVLARLDLIGDLHGQQRLAGASLLSTRIAAGAGGRAAGKGIYIYPAEGDKRPDPAVLAWADERRAEGRDAMPELDPSRALHAALVNGSARLLAGHVVQRASDLDLVVVRGLGFAAAQGGPLLQADMLGLLTLLKAMKQAVPLAPAIWTPHPMIEAMVKNGEGFFRRPGA